MKFCFSTYSTLLKNCKMPTVTQKDFITALISTVDSESVYNVDEAAISCYVRGTKNISPIITVLARSCVPSDIANAFERAVIPLLDQNKNGNLILAMKDLIAKDNIIEDSSVIDYVSKHTKYQIINDKNIFLNNFLAGLFLYVLLNTKNNGTKIYADKITDEYITSFNKKKSDLKIISSASSVQATEEAVLHASEYDLDDEVLEKARLFCIEHEKKKCLLPLCEIASILNPKHEHINPIINAFNKKPKKIQYAILVSEHLKPYKCCTWNEIDKCIAAFKKEIEEKKYTTRNFLYDGAKYFHRALERYADYKPEFIDPYIFKRMYITNGNLSNLSGCLSSYIADYDYGLKNYPNDKNEPPFDALWNGLNLTNCEEKTLVFWVNRFIVSVCHYLHGFDINGEYDESWEYKDIVTEDAITTMEELYYYALFLLYKSYSNEGKTK